MDDESGGYWAPLTFVCQVNLVEVAPLDTEGWLPKEGMLYFFAPIDYFLGETDSPLDVHQPPIILYAEQTAGLHPYDLHWEDTGETVFREAEAMEFAISTETHADGHRLLCRPLSPDAEDQHPGKFCLLQIDEDERWGLRFFDTGVYSFLIAPDDLRQRRWNKVEGDLFYL